ncbi:MAG: hypothetical protein KF705_15135 [Phycisphaeraceae bacterium]|nr:hypothetical protein [Phycisphaeraceae bacterium]
MSPTRRVCRCGRRRSRLSLAVEAGLCERIGVDGCGLVGVEAEELVHASALGLGIGVDGFVADFEDLAVELGAGVATLGELVAPGAGGPDSGDVSDPGL